MVKYNGETEHAECDEVDYIVIKNISRSTGIFRHIGTQFWNAAAGSGLILEVIEQALSQVSPRAARRGRRRRGSRHGIEVGIAANTDRRSKQEIDGVRR
jgi:hypothetical protein